MAITDENISKRLVSAFNAKDLKDVATKLDEKYTSLHNWASGRRDFPTKILIKIAKLTNVSIDWILTGEGDKPLKPSDRVNLDETIRKIVREIVREEFELFVTENKQIPIQDLGAIDAFDLEKSIKKYNSVDKVLEDWYRHEGKDIPEGFSGFLYQGWENLSFDEKVEAIKQQKKLLDKTSKDE